MLKRLLLMLLTSALMLGCAGRVNYEDPTIMTSVSWVQTCLDRMGYQPGRTDGVMDHQSKTAYASYLKDYMAEEITGMGRDLRNKDTRLDANKLFAAECTKIAGPRDDYVIYAAH